MNFLEDYSFCYDLLYKDKNYKEEVQFIDQLIKEYNPQAKSLLEVGCGTGEHANIFSQLGYEVRAVDRSQSMIYLAKQKYPALNLEVEDALNLALHKKTDVVCMLFHVFSYFVDDKSIVKLLESLRKQVSLNGIVIFDYWYTPAVNNLKPLVKTKQVSGEGNFIERVSTPRRISEKVIEVDFKIKLRVADKKTEKTFFETHPMRHFNLGELSSFLKGAGFEIVKHGGWMNLGSPTERDWAAYIVARVV